MPSLVVDARKQLWNCLGLCHEGGDVYRFVMKANGVDFCEAHLRLKAGAGIGEQESETRAFGAELKPEDRQWLERAIDHYHRRLLETPAAQDYLRSRGVTAVEIATSFRLGYSDETLGEKLPAEGRRALRRVGVLTGSSRQLLRGCVIFPLVNATTGQVVNLYGRSIEGRRHLYLPGERRSIFNPQGAKNTEEVIITESVIDAAALWNVGLRNVIPVYGVTGLTEETMMHLVECRVRRVVLMLARKSNKATLDLVMIIDSARFSSSVCYVVALGSTLQSWSRNICMLTSLLYLPHLPVSACKE